MEANKFLKDFVEIFDDKPTETVTMKTVFRDIEGWDSMAALGLMAMVDVEYKIKISGQEIKDSQTVGELYNIINNKHK
jgi:acyl carrier protein